MTSKDCETLYELRDIAKLFGVGSSAVSNWQKRGSGPKLPEPKYVTRSGRPLFTEEQMRMVIADNNARMEMLLSK